jgi:hypothetical protein
MRTRDADSVEAIDVDSRSAEAAYFHIVNLDPGSMREKNTALCITSLTPGSQEPQVSNLNVIAAFHSERPGISTVDCCPALTIGAQHHFPICRATIPGVKQDRACEGLPALK